MRMTHHHLRHLLQERPGLLMHLANVAIIPAQPLRLEPVHELHQLLLVETGFRPAAPRVISRGESVHAQAPDVAKARQRCRRWTAAQPNPELPRGSNIILRSVMKARFQRLPTYAVQV